MCYEITSVVIYLPTGFLYAFAESYGSTLLGKQKKMKVKKKYHFDNKYAIGSGI